MNFFLSIKSWQLFLLIMAPMFIPMVAAASPDSMWVFSIASVAWMFVLVGWLLSVGLASNGRLPPELAKGTKFYIFGYVFAVAYMTFMLFGVMPGLMQQPAGEPPFWILPAHLTAMVGMFYGLWFTAKQFTTLQRNKQVSFFEYSGPFFLFWFCFIGVWFIQPKVNTLLGSKNGA